MALFSDMAADKRVILGLGVPKGLSGVALPKQLAFRWACQNGLFSDTAAIKNGRAGALEGAVVRLGPGVAAFRWACPNGLFSDMAADKNGRFGDLACPRQGLPGPSVALPKRLVFWYRQQ